VPPGGLYIFSLEIVFFLPLYGILQSMEENMYIKRLIDHTISESLRISGGLLIEGPKSCGKTSSAKQVAKSEVSLDIDENAALYIDTAPGLLLAGETPRLIDEWQIYPQIWNHVRHEIDTRQKPGQFILAGSSTPKRNTLLHSGAGRILPRKMRTLSLYEIDQHENIMQANISVSDLVKGKPLLAAVYKEATLDELIDLIRHGFWPGFYQLSTSDAVTNIEGYLGQIINVDISEVDDIKRDPAGVRAFMKVAAKNVATYCTKEALARQTASYLDREPKSSTIAEYISALERLGIFERQHSWMPHLRARYSVRKAAKLHFCEPSLACALLGVTHKQLKDDLNYLGFLFESLVFHNISAYASVSGGEILQYHDSRGLEVDQIFMGKDGSWGAVEVKLGAGVKTMDEAARNLLTFANTVDTQHMGTPGCLAIITGLGNKAFTRADGVQVIPLRALKP
jgi:predicted AAA+ superfamily ATPase